MVWFHTVGDLYDLWLTYPAESGQTYCLVSHGARAAVVLLVTWCTVWKGTAQDCVPPLVKAANLACWPWTVTREQWSSMSRPAVSGIAVDTAALGCRCSTVIGSSIVRELMGLSVALTCDGCMLFSKSRYVGVIVDALGILRHGCRGQLFRTRKTRRQKFLLDPK